MCLQIQQAESGECPAALIMCLSSERTAATGGDVIEKGGASGALLKEAGPAGGFRGPITEGGQCDKVRLSV